MDVRFHFVRERVASKELEIRFVPTKEQLADGLTKPLARDHFRSSMDVILRGHRERQPGHLFNEVSGQ